jgi:hypothetical protein
VNVGEQTIDWLYREQLQVDDQWSIRTPVGFTWWAERNAQTIEILGEETGPDGRLGYLIGVRTDLVCDVELSEGALSELNEGPMRFAALAAPVYDRETRTMSLCSLARIHVENAEWVRVVLGSAAVLQIAEARLLGPALAETLGGLPAFSEHPQQGLRTTPDELTYAVNVFVEEGKAPSEWPEQDFTAAVNQFMTQPPSIGASSDGQGLGVEFPFGDGSSLCQVMGTQAHPLYGNGLFVLQRFPFRADSPAQGAELALILNAAEFTGSATGFGFGSYVYDNDTLCFTAFFPNVLHRQVALPFLYFACAARALAMSVWLLGEQWGDLGDQPRQSG